MVCNVEVLEIAEQKRLRRLAVHRRREDRLPQLVERNVRDARHALCHAVVALGGRRGLEHDRICHDRRSHQSCQPVRRQQSPLLIHRGDDRCRRADRLVSKVDRRARLDVGKAVVVNDFQNVRLLQPRYRLGHLVVVDEHHALAARL